jgi:hypothetical protein
MDSMVSATNGDFMSRTARRFAPATTLVALMLGAGPAMAAPPEPVPVPPFMLLFRGLGCPDFNLGIEWTGGKRHSKIFVDKNDNPVRKIEAGKGFLLTYTNFGPDPADPIAGQSIKIKTGGSVSSTRFNPDGTETVTASTTRRVRCPRRPMAVGGIAAPGIVGRRVVENKWTSRSGGVRASISSRNRRNSAARWQGKHRPITVPALTSRAANRLVVS